MTGAGNKLTIRSVLWRRILSHPVTRPATKQAQREASVDNLLGAALRLFVSQGFRHTTVENIADEAGLTKGSVYFYFDTKAALLVRLLDRVEAVVVGEMEARVDNLHGANASPGEKITPVASFSRVMRWRSRVPRRRTPRSNPISGSPRIEVFSDGVTRHPRPSNSSKARPLQ